MFRQQNYQDHPILGRGDENLAVPYQGDRPHYGFKTSYSISQNQVCDVESQRFAATEGGPATMNLNFLPGRKNEA